MRTPALSCPELSTCLGIRMGSECTYHGSAMDALVVKRSSCEHNQLDDHWQVDGAHLVRVSLRSALILEPKSARIGALNSNSCRRNVHQAMPISRATAT